MMAESCSNLNHRRSDAPVRACPQCGGVVNAKIAAARCTAAEHASRLKDGDAFCLRCGAGLRGR
jgi:hypothetical protein